VTATDAGAPARGVDRPSRWELRTCGRKGHQTYAPHEGELAQRLSGQTGAGQVWRCLRCGDFVLGAPHGAGPADQAPLVLRGKALRSAIILRVLAVERLVRTVLLALAVYGVLRFRASRGSIQAGLDRDLPALPAAGIHLDQLALVHELQHALTTGKSTAGTPPDSLAVALAFGLVLVALVGALGQVSGAHLNAAVTLGLAVTRKFPWRYVPSYLGFQLLGAVLGAGATWAAFGSVVRDKAHLGATVPAQGVSDGRAFLVEALITFLLVFVIVAVATDQRVPATVAGPAIGFALIAAVLIGGGVTGGAVNPDRALGPAIMSGTFTSLWLYVVAPLVGGIAAAVLYDRVIGRATAPTMTDGDPQAQVGAGNRSLATGTPQGTTAT